MSNDQRLYMASGFDGMLCKPLDLKALSSDIRGFLKVCTRVPAVPTLPAVR